MHCYFVLAGNAEIPIVYHVERVRDGKSFATRTVQARQRGQPIFTTTMSFTRENSGGKKLIEHAADMPKVPGPVDDEDLDLASHGPFQSQRIDILNNDSPRPQDKKTRQWIKARGNISAGGGHQAHLSALAYMSDSYFVGTIARVHKLWRYSSVGKDKNGKSTKASIDESVLKKLREMDTDTLRRMQGMDDDVIEELKRSADPDHKFVERPEIGMMVSLDHTIYFHEPRAFQADEWMFTEMESPWAGDGRGLVIQKMYTKEGKLIATCVQEVSVILNDTIVEILTDLQLGCCPAQARSTEQTLSGLDTLQLQWAHSDGVRRYSSYLTNRDYYMEEHPLVTHDSWRSDTEVHLIL